MDTDQKYAIASGKFGHGFDHSLPKQVHNMAMDGLSQEEINRAYASYFSDDTPPTTSELARIAFAVENQSVELRAIRNQFEMLRLTLTAQTAAFTMQSNHVINALEIIGERLR